jgi:hypothetical protein
VLAVTEDGTPDTTELEIEPVDEMPAPSPNPEASRAGT